MDNFVKNYWQIRLNHLKQALTGNNFEVFLADNTMEAKKIVMEEILPKINPTSISWGDSLTCQAAGLWDDLIKSSKLEVLNPFEENISEEEMYERCRQALLTDLFLTGTNAVTETGTLVNLDGWGNRVAGLTFGPRYVIVLIGRNKIVPDLEEAMFRVKNYAAPVNAIRFDVKTPCVKTSYCEECNSPERICSSWTLTEKSYPKGRVKVVLINEDLGF